MLVIPEHNVILILPPRTGSTSLVKAVRDKNPNAFLIYRHAEADAVPPGYEKMRVMGFVRHPLARMWSLFKFFSMLDVMASAKWAQGDVLRLGESVQGRSFEDWLLHNEELFLPEGTGNAGLYQKHYIPETRKSQEVYLRPDLGTEVLNFSALPVWMERWGLDITYVNHSPKTPMPAVSGAVELHLAEYMGWEYQLGLEIL